eukprot:jgi/Botrbrau1/10217/Bobra.0362s0007.1
MASVNISNEFKEKLIQKFYNAMLGGLDQPPTELLKGDGIKKVKRLQILVQLHLGELCLRNKDWGRGLEICKKLKRSCYASAKLGEVFVASQLTKLHKLEDNLRHNGRSPNVWRDFTEQLKFEECCWDHMEAARAGHATCLGRMAKEGQLLAGWPAAIDADSPWTLPHVWNDWEGKERIWAILGDLPRNRAHADRPSFLELELLHTAVQCTAPTCLEALLDAGCRSPWICNLAVIERKESFLRLAADRGCPCEVRAVYFAARSGSLPILKVVYSLARVASGAALRGFSLKRDDGALTWLLNRSAVAAAGGGHAECLEALLTWFGKCGVDAKRHVCEAAASRCHLECLKVLQRAGCLFGGAAAEKAARAGHYECLRYIMSHAEGLTKTGLLLAAAEGGSLECMKHLLECGVQWDHNLPWKEAWHAARGGHSPVLAYCLARCPHQDLHKIMRQAISSKSTACMEVLYRHGYKAVTDPHQHPALLAISSCSIECLEVALQRSGPPDPDLLDTAAAAWAGEAMLERIHGLGGVISYRTVLAAAKAGNAGALRYALQHKRTIHIAAVVAAFRSSSLACLQLLHKHPHRLSVQQHGNKPLKHHSRQCRPSLAVLRYMCEHMYPNALPHHKERYKEQLDFAASELLKGLKVHGGLKPNEWLKVLCLARCLPTLPQPLHKMVKVHRERAVALANCFFQAGKLDRIWGVSHLPGAAGWGAMARLPPSLRERIACEAHLCISRGEPLES